MAIRPLPLWWVTISTPLDVREAMPQNGHGRQIRVYGRARSRVAFARMLIAAGLEHGSEASVSRWIADYGGTTEGVGALAACTADGQLYVAPLDGPDAGPYLSYPLT